MVGAALLFYGGLSSKFSHSFPLELPLAPYEPDQWTRIQGMYELVRDLAHDPARARTLRFHCKDLTSLEKVRDTECRAEWLHHLSTARIVAIENMMGFAMGKKGAFEVRFADGRKAMFKPCGSGREWPENEVRASHVDYALGLHRAPPAVMRSLSLDSIRLLLSQQVGKLSLLDNSAWILQQLEDTCALEDHLQGAMIGWFPELENAVTIPKRLEDTSVEEVREYRRSAPPSEVMDVMQNHLFFFLLHTIRQPGYNEYRIRDGPLLTVDLDRADFRPGPSSIRPLHKLSMCYFCMMDASLYETLLESIDNNSLLITMQQSLSWQQQPMAWTRDEGDTLQRRIEKYLQLCLQPCIERYGYEEVIRTAPSPLPVQ